jgi:CRISPR/Cas system endoribonuclease Cas6 (RAMP superfamily)
MLYSVEMVLGATSSSDDAAIDGHHVLGLFLRLIENKSPVLAAELHRDSAVKPFTLSPLLLARGELRHAVLSEGRILSFRITLLGERAFAAPADAVWRLS